MDSLTLHSSYSVRDSIREQKHSPEMFLLYEKELRLKYQWVIFQIEKAWAIQCVLSWRQLINQRSGYSLGKGKKKNGKKWHVLSRLKNPNQLKSVKAK